MHHSGALETDGAAVLALGVLQHAHAVHALAVVRKGRCAQHLAGALELHAPPGKMQRGEGLPLVEVRDALEPRAYRGLLCGACPGGRWASVVRRAGERAPSGVAISIYLYLYLYLSIYLSMNVSIYIFLSIYLFVRAPHRALLCGAWFGVWRLGAFGVWCRIWDWS